MVDTLMNKYCIKEAKTFDTSYKFPFELIPKEYHSAFIRGFMDGDGTISKEDLRFVFNSKVFAEQIVNIFRDLFSEWDIIQDFKYTLSEINGKTVKY